MGKEQNSKYKVRQNVWSMGIAQDFSAYKNGYSRAHWVAQTWLATRIGNIGCKTLLYY